MIIDRDVMVMKFLRQRPSIKFKVIFEIISADVKSLKYYVLYKIVEVQRFAFNYLISNYCLGNQNFKCGSKFRRQREATNFKLDIWT